MKSNMSSQKLDPAMAGKKALFIGRFQPLHIGHINALKQIETNPEVDEIIIGVGSSQYSNTEDNPYSFEQREIFINKVLKGKLGKPYKIIAIPDIHDEKNWVAHVQKIIPDFDLVFTGNDWVGELFKEKNIPLREIKFNVDVSGTDLRRLMREKDEKWKEYVPEELIEEIEK
ncbi:MAG: nicotinamide-nucleotide adenylyltransferase [Patescibacteria group bacterium]|nr:nicotinamide-nucleotide adenylyltransferase [Patescibacteria group bacterium]